MRHYIYGIGSSDDMRLSPADTGGHFISISKIKILPRNEPAIPEGEQETVDEG